MKWIDPKNELPPNNVKVLVKTLDRGIVVAQRFGDLWIPSLLGMHSYKPMFWMNLPCEKCGEFEQKCK